VANLIFSGGWPVLETTMTEKFAIIHTLCRLHSNDVSVAANANFFGGAERGSFMGAALNAGENIVPRSSDSICDLAMWDETAITAVVLYC